MVDLVHHPEALGHRQKRARRDQGAVAVPQSQEHLAAVDRPVREVEDRLLIQHEGVVPQGVAQAFRPRQLSLHSGL